MAQNQFIKDKIGVHRSEKPLAYLFEQELQVMYRRSWQERERQVQSMAEGDERTKLLEELDQR